MEIPNDRIRWALGEIMEHYGIEPFNDQVSVSYISKLFGLPFIVVQSNMSRIIRTVPASNWGSVLFDALKEEQKDLGVS